MKDFQLQIGLSVIFFSIFNIGVQSQYITTLTENTEWYNYSWFEIYTNEYIYLSGDTLIDGNTYMQIVKQGAWEAETFFLREDGENEKIYQRLNNTDFLLYDYNLSVGDTFHYDNPQWSNTDYYLVLDSITDTIYTYNNNILEYNLESTKVYYFHNAQSQWKDNIVWVEGIGSLAGLLQPYHNWLGGSEGETLLCHYDENGIRDFHYIYIEEPSPCMGWVGLQDHQVNSIISIYPNPATDYVDISTSNGGMFSFEISSINGQHIKSGKNIGSKKVDIRNLEAGIYILNIKTEGELFHKKIIIE